MSRYKKWRKLFIIAGILLVLLLACDMRLKTVFYTIESEKIDQPVRIALITDLHSDWYGENQRTLILAIDDQMPDVVLLGGDIFDDKGTYEYAEITLKQLAEKYPCYYVTGNHEYWSRDIDNILGIVESYGIPALSGDCHTLEINGQMINICGVDDPDVVKYTENGKQITEQLKLAEEAAAGECFTILLSHRPELKEMYEEYKFDLVLSGHAHGGQWRIPFLLNGLYAPNQGLFPQYAGGRYDYENGALIVSRGLARESTPIPRIFNRPELVIVDIR